MDGPHAGLADAREQHLDGLGERLQGEAKLALQGCIARQPFRAVKRRVQRMEQLHDLNVKGANVPEVILEAEGDRLREEAEQAIAHLLASESPTHQ